MVVNSFYINLGMRVEANDTDITASNASIRATVNKGSGESALVRRDSVFASGHVDRALGGRLIGKKASDISWV